MIKPRHIEHVCRPFCSFFREGAKEDEACGGLMFLDRRFPQNELYDLVGRIAPTCTPAGEFDAALKPLLCDPCAFRVEDCDFRAGLPSPPCGGYVVLTLLLTKGLVGEDDI